MRRRLATTVYAGLLALTSCGKGEPAPEGPPAIPAEVWQGAATEPGAAAQLAEVSREAAAALPGLTITLFVSRDLPEQITRGDLGIRPDAVAERLDELVSAYAAAGDGVRVERVRDGAARRAEQAGIPPVTSSRVVEGQVRSERYALGALLEWRSERQALLLIAPPEQLEYTLTAAMLRLAAGERPKVGVVCAAVTTCLVGPKSPEVDADGLAAQELRAQLAKIDAGRRRLLEHVAAAIDQSAASKDVALVPVRLEEGVPDGVGALLVIAPTGPLGEDTLRELDAHLEGGGRLIVLHAPWEARLPPGAPGAGLTRRQTDVGAWLERLGVAPRGDLVLEPERHDALVRIVAEQRGSLQVQSRRVEPYPMLPRVDVPADSPLSSFIGRVSLPFATSFELSRDARPTLESSARAVSIRRGDFPLEPLTQRSRVMDEPSGRALTLAAVAAEGKLLVIGSGLGLDGLSVHSVYAGLEDPRMLADPTWRAAQLQRFQQRLIDWQDRLSALQEVARTALPLLAEAIRWGAQDPRLSKLLSP